MRLLSLLVLLSIIVLPVSALEIEAPPIPGDAAMRMPEDTDSILTGVTELLRKAVDGLYPDLREAGNTALRLIAVAMLTAVISALGSANKAVDLAAVTATASLMLESSGSMIRLAADTVRSITSYGTLLLPVMTSALAAQGSVTASTALCAGTSLFIAAIQSVLDRLFLPGIWFYLALRTGCAATGEALPGRIGDLIKSVLVWSMKILMMVFTTYISLTGVLSGTTDAVARKAVKVSISTVVPVIGGTLSDAAEAVLVSAQMMKNTAGIYGIFAVLALFLQPFLKIGMLYLMLKATAAVCSVIGTKPVTGILDSFGTAMGMLLGIIACGCTMMLISTVCFLKGGTI